MVAGRVGRRDEATPVGGQVLAPSREAGEHLWVICPRSRSDGSRMAPTPRRDPAIPGIDVDRRVFAHVADARRARRITAAIAPGVEAYFGALLGEVRED